MSYQSLKADAEAASKVRARDGVPQQYTLQDLLRKPRFFDWVECEVNGNPFEMYLAGADDAVALRFYWNGRYEPFTLSLWSSLVASATGITVDIGAHTGAYSLAATAAGASELYSFEPHFANFARMQLNYRANGFSLDRAYMMAVGEASEWSTFHLSTALDYLSTGGGLKERAGSRKFPVQVVSLDEFFEPAHYSNIEVIKVDVEGLEPQVLRGSTQIVQQSRPIIFFECIDQQSGDDVQQILGEFGYSYFMVCDASAKLIPIDNISPALTNEGQIDMSRLNRIAVPSEASDLLQKA